MAVATVNLKFGVNIKDFQTKLDQVEKQSVKFGRKMTSAGRDMSMFITAPLAGFATLAGSMAMSFDDSMRKVMATSGATSQEFEAMRKKAKEMGAQTRFSASESAEAMNFMALAGWKSSQIIDGLDGVLMTAAASGEDLGTVADIITDGLTAFGKSAGFASQFGDILAATASNANTTIGMLGEAFKYAAPLAGTLGYRVEDTSLALGLMANAGIKASQAGTTLRQIMTNLAKPTSESERAMKELGISAVNADGSMKPLSDLMVEFREKISRLPEAQQAMYAGMIAGQRGLSGFLAVVNASQDDFDSLSESINNSAGASKTMTALMEGGLGGAIRSLRSATEGLIVSFGEILTPFIVKMAESLKSLVNWFSTLSTSVKTGITVFGGLLAAVGPVMLMIGTFATKVVPLFIGGLKIIGIAAAGVSAPILGIAAAVAAAGILIYKYWDEIKLFFRSEAVTGLFDAARETWEAFKSYISEFWQTIKPIVTVAFGFLKEVFSTSFKVLGTYIKTFIDNSIVILRTGFEVLTNLFKTLKGVVTLDWRTAWEGLKGIFSSVWKGITDIFANTLGNMGRMIGKFLNKLRINSIGDKMLEFSEKMKSFGSTTTKVLEEVKEQAEETSRAIESVVNPLGDEKKGPGGGFGKSISRSMASAIGSVPRMDINIDPLKQKIEEIGIITQSLTPKMESIAVDITDGFNRVINDGIMGGLVVLGEGVGGLISGAANIGDVANNLLNVLGGVMNQLGQLAIGAGIAVLGIKKALETLNPFVAIGAGIALLALSKVVTGRMKSMGNGMGSSGGGPLGAPSSVPGRAMGGTVVGGKQYIVGERGPEMFTPGVSGYISPNQKAFGNIGQQIKVTVEGILRGEDIHLSGERYLRSVGRTT